jgi:murein DD-endopeptidase MepM/ murein hydrolase activator NlpD
MVSRAGGSDADAAGRSQPVALASRARLVDSASSAADTDAEAGEWESGDALDALPPLSLAETEAGLAAVEETEGGDAEPDAAATDQDPPVEGVPQAGAGTVVFEARVGDGNTITEKLSRYGLTGRQIGEVVDALEGSFDFRQSRPDHRFVLEVAQASGEVRRFRYEAGASEIYEVERRGTGLKARRIEIAVKRTYVMEGRRIKTTLEDAIAQAGLKRQALRAFLQTFGRDISFVDEQRPGDTFRVIAEEERVDGEFTGYKAIWALEYTRKSRRRLQAFYFRPPEGTGRFYDESGLSFEQTKLRTPVSYSRISSPFDSGRMHPVLHRRMPHNGVDFAAPRGTPVHATAEGTVTFAGRKGPSGNLVVITHPGGFQSAYAHLQSFAKGLKRGQEVRQGELIGTVGSTGRSTGPHLHFGIKVKGRFVDPARFKTGPGRPIEAEHRSEFLATVRSWRRELSKIQIE